MIEPTVMRGFNDAWGSWNTICIRGRIFRSTSPLVSVSSTPSKVTVPSVASSSCRITRPQVDFPDPLSPTSPSVSPR